MVRLPERPGTSLAGLLRADVQAWGDVLVYRGMPLALREEIYTIISLCHIQHGPRAIENTLGMIDRMWCGIEMQHVKAFVNGCRECAEQGGLVDQSSAAPAPTAAIKCEDDDHQDGAHHTEEAHLQRP